MPVANRSALLQSTCLSVRQHLGRTTWLTPHMRAGPILPAAAALMAMCSPAFAQDGAVLPTDGVFAAGSGKIGTNGRNSMEITQDSQRGVIDWSSFSIGSDAKVMIDNADGATLNRVLGNQISRLDGQLSATGSVFLMNPHGVIVGPEGRINTGGSFVATTRAVDPEGFMAGGVVRASGNSDGDIVNRGSIVSDHGSVVMIARSVTNEGVVEATQGNASLIAANDVLLGTLDSSAEGIFVSFQPESGGDVTQAGRVEAASAALHAAGGNVFALAGNRSGLEQVTGTEVIDGQLWLTAPNGSVEVTGRLSSINGDGSGGRIAVEGQDILIASGAQLSASGTQGGEIVVGASGFGTGAGLSDTTTVESGAVLTAGGRAGGGRIETSGLVMHIGEARIDPGAGGLWLLDPDDLTIDTALASTITASLDAGSNVTQQTTASGTGGNGDITVAAPVVWTGSGNLTLDAVRNIAVNADISGGGSLTLSAQGNTTIAAGTSIASASDILIETGSFTNLSGPYALSAGSQWLVYSGDPATDDTGGLTPDFYQYDAPAGTPAAAVGNGLIYSVAPSVTIALGNVEKSYDGTVTAFLDDGNTTVSGLINGDTWSLDGTYASKDAATGIEVTADNFLAFNNGIPVYGYGNNAPVTSATGTINPADLVAAIVGTPTKTYNGTTSVSLSAVNFELTGVADGESITINSAASAAYDAADAGSRTVDASLAISSFTAGAGTDLSNYVLPAQATGAGLIDPATLIVSGVSAEDKVYDGTTAAALNTNSASVFGIIGSDDVSLETGSASGTFATKNVGTAIAVSLSGVTLSGADAGNYVVDASPGLAANITPATLTVSGLAANDKIYDGTTLATLDLSGANLTGLIAGDDISVDSAGSQANFATKNAGQDIAVSVSGVSLTGADAGNYDVSFSGSLSADIEQRVLTLDYGGGMPTKVYDGTTNLVLSADDAAFGNLVAGESISISQIGNLEYASKNVGIWDITGTLTPADFVAGPDTLLSNYVLPTSAMTQGEITPAPLSIQIINDPTKGYDGNTNASLGPDNFAVSGFVVGEGATVTETSGQYSSPDAGTRTVTAELDDSDFAPEPGTLMSNYYIPSPVYGPGTITRIPLGPGVINVDITGNPSKIYDGTTIATLTPGDYTLSGFIAGEGATITETVGQYDLKDAGQRVVLVMLDPGDFAANAGTNLDNYVLPDQATGIGTIFRKQLTASIIGNPTKIYNSTVRAIVTAANYNVAGVIAGESVSVSPGVIANYNDADVGNRIITASFTADSNFIFSANTLSTNYILPAVATGPGTITPAPLTILGVNAQNKVYDQTTLASLTGSATLFGVIAGDTVTVEGGSAAGTFATPNVGNDIAVTVDGYSISGADAGNYQLFQPTGLTADITPRGIAVADVAALDKFYDGTNVATLDLGSASLTGVLSGDDVALDPSGYDAQFLQKNVGTNLRVIVGGIALNGAQAGNYRLTQPSGLTADINPLQLTGAIVGNPTKTYDGTASVSLGAANYELDGFIAGEGGTITQSAGAVYDSANAGSRIVTATIVSSDVTPDAGTLLSNYILPSEISGAGTINQAMLAVAIVGNPTKIYDSTTDATLTSANYSLSGFVAGESGTVTETTGAYDTKNVGSRTVTATLDSGDFVGSGATSMANYVLPTSASGVGTITPADIQVINVTANDKVYDGTTAATLNSGSASLSGVFAGDSVSVVSSGATGTFATKNVGTDIVVTANGYTTAGADAGNYNLLQPTGLFADITQATISLASVTKVYDSTTAAPSDNSAYALAGVFGSDDVSVDASGISGDYNDKNVGSNKPITLAGVAITGADAGNYLISDTTSNAPIGIITPAELTVIGVDAADKVYDQSAVATLFNGGADLAGVFAGDDVVLDSTGSSGFFSDGAGNPDPNAGTNKPIVTSGYVVTGSDASNYTVTQPDYVTASITPREITLTSVVKIYDGTTDLPGDAAAYSFAGVLGGDAVVADASSASGNYADPNVGGAISGGVVVGGIDVDVAGLSLGGAQGQNYFVADVDDAAIGVINPKALTASIIGNPTKTYDALTAANLTSANYQIDGFVAGEGADITQTAGVYDSPNAGSRTVTASLAAGDFDADTGTLLTNYILPTQASGAGTIDQAVLTILGVTAQDKVYDGTTTAVLNSASAALSGIVAAEPNTITLDSSGVTGVFAQADVGTGIAVTASGYAVVGDVNNNYILTQPTGLFADITQALLTVTRVTRVYDGTVDLPTDTAAWSLGGIVGNDDVFVDTGLISGAYADPNVASGIAVTASGIALGGLDGGNYSIDPSLSAAPIGVMTPASLSVSIIGDPTKTYDGNTNASLTDGNFALTGFVAGESATINQTTGTYASADAGSWTVSASLTASNFDAHTGTLLSNYVLPTEAQGSGTIEQALLAVSITGDPTKTYDGNTDAALTSGDYSLTGFVAGQGATINQTAGSYASANAGSWNVTASLSEANFDAENGTSLSNYVLPTQAQGLGTIEQALLTASIVGDPTKTYDGNTDATLVSGNYALTGFVAGEGAAITQTSGRYDQKNAGDRAVTAVLDTGDFTANGGTLLTNYILPTEASGAGTIEQAVLAVSITGDPTKSYDGNVNATLASGDYTLTGFVAGEGATIHQTSGTYASANAGNWNVTANLGQGNFDAATGTMLSNYVLPTEAQGLGTIEHALLSVSIIGDPTKTYDGNTQAALVSGNYALTGFVAGEGATITQTAGRYDEKNAGDRTVTATLGAGDFTANSGTLLSNYALPTAATGAGTIEQALLSVSITGLPTKSYDGTDAATLAASNYDLSGFVAGEGATITQTSGTYSSANAGIRSVNASLAESDFRADAGTTLSNYVLPTTADGFGIIERLQLVATVTGNPTKTYDANTIASLTSGDYTLSGFIAGESGTITETSGAYDSPNAGSRLVTVSLGSADFIAGSNTLLTNYILPTEAQGAGTIDPAALSATIIGKPTKIYDGTRSATLASDNYLVTGFVGSDAATVTETSGLYDEKNAGDRIVTAVLGANDFIAGTGTLLSNYVLPTSAEGAGTITPRPLDARLGTSIVNNPTKVYDGNRIAFLDPSNFAIDGFAPGEGATVTKTTGLYAFKDVGSHRVEAILSQSDYTADPGTDLGNYVLPLFASGQGTIIPAELIATIIGDPTKTYDGNTNAMLASGNYAIIGFVAGEGARVTQTDGIYDEKNAGDRIVTAMLNSGDFIADDGTLLTNYVLPTKATGGGTIDRALLAASIIGDPTKTYDGNTNAALNGANFELTGFIAGEGAFVTQTSGLYDEKNAGARTVSTTLESSDFVADAGTSLANYVLPVEASGAGTIDRAPLTVSIVGNPTKFFDGNREAILTSDNFAISGFVAGEGATITQSAGLYDGPAPGIHLVTAQLSEGDYLANSGTSMSNYDVATVATGPGTIVATGCLPGPDGQCSPNGPDIKRRLMRAFGNPHFYIPYPLTNAIYLGKTNAFAGLPTIMKYRGSVQADGSIQYESGAAVVNATDRILLQGHRDKQWTIQSTLPEDVSFEGRP
jgi:filamentous hemagglutinin family protein